MQSRKRALVYIYGMRRRAEHASAKRARLLGATRNTLKGLEVCRIRICISRMASRIRDARVAAL